MERRSLEPNEPKSRRVQGILLIITVPFLLNDLGNILATGYAEWLLIDYASRVVPLAILAFLLFKKEIRFAEVGLVRLGIGQFIFWTLLMSVAGLVLDQLGPNLLAHILPNKRLGSIPPVPNGIVRQLDLYLGLSLVAVSEEVVFRGFYFTKLTKGFARLSTVFGVSSIAFGLIHWSLGVAVVVNTALTT